MEPGAARAGSVQFGDRAPASNCHVGRRQQPHVPSISLLASPSMLAEALLPAPAILGRGRVRSQWGRLKVKGQEFQSLGIFPGLKVLTLSLWGRKIRAGSQSRTRLIVVGR